MTATTRKTVKAAPSRAAAKDAPVVFEYEDLTYTITRADADNLEIFELIEDDQLIRATRALLGPKQWEQWKDAQRDPKTRTVPVTAFSKFLDAVMDAIGGN